MFCDYCACPVGSYKKLTLNSCRMDRAARRPEAKRMFQNSPNNFVLASDTQCGKVVHVLIKTLCHLDLEGVEVYIHSFLTLALYGDDQLQTHVALVPVN